MDRQGAVLLLKEIMSDCESFHSAKAVSIEFNPTMQSWELKISWVPHPSETECLQKIIVKHGLVVITSSEQTVFRSK